MNKTIKYVLIAAVIVLVGYKSVYIKKLSDVKGDTARKFDAVKFAQKLWEEKMPARIDSAIDLAALIHFIATDKDNAFKNYTHALDIGNYRYALVKTKATVTAVNEDEVLIQIRNGGVVMNDILATEYIYGNAIRDGSSLVDVKDFPVTSDLNGISAELNKIVRETVLPSFKKVVKKGDQLNIVAALQLNKAHIKWDGLELLPVRLQIVQ